MRAGPEAQHFETCKADLMAQHPGQFAVITGRQVRAVCPTLDEAIALIADDFDSGRLPEGATVFVSEISDSPQVRLTADSGSWAARFAVTPLG